MPKKHLTNLAVLMDLLNITTVELAKAICMERTSISKWRHGANKILADMPYFEEMVNYFVQKNKQLGNELLENYFESVYPVKKRIHKDYLKKCIRSYILNIPDSRRPGSNTEPLQIEAQSHMYVTKCDGFDGRMELFSALLEAAEKLPTFAVIKIFECDELNWVSCHMQYSVLFYQRLKNLLNLGHKLELIFQINTDHAINLMLHQIFLELAFHENFSMYTYNPRLKGPEISSTYVLVGRMAIVGHCFEPDKSDMISCLYQNNQYAKVQEMIWEEQKKVSTHIPVIVNHSQIEEVIHYFECLSDRPDSYFHSGKALSLATMSEELLDEILTDNHFTNQEKKLCFEFYHAYRSNIESSKADSMSGFYYVLDEIVSPLAYPTITNYALSAITGKHVGMSREQYLRHFKDTAEILLRDKRYRILLHFSVIPTPVTISPPKLICLKNNSWVIVINTDGLLGKTKFMFGFVPQMLSFFQRAFSEIYEKIPDYKKDNEYVAKIFMKIANGERI